MKILNRMILSPLAQELWRTCNISWMRRLCQMSMENGWNNNWKGIKLFEGKPVPFVPCPQDIRHEMPKCGTLRPTLTTPPKLINIYWKLSYILLSVVSKLPPLLLHNLTWNFSLIYFTFALFTHPTKYLIISIEQNHLETNSLSIFKKH